MMRDQARHDMLPDANRDELARQDYVFSVKQYVTGNLAAGSKAHYQRTTKPRLARSGSRPMDWRSVRRELEPEPHYRMIGSIKRTIQELIWDTTGESIERQLPALIDTANRLRARKTNGSLRLDPSLVAPRYLSACDIHSMPGNYHVELTKDDVYAGALYERGVYLFSLGGGGARSENYGLAVASFVDERLPDFAPRRILELGCSAGSTALALAQSFPDAEVHAIDVGAPLLRYAHARAELVGGTIHFSQQNAEETDFDDGSFDLIVSTGLLHETSGKALPRIMAECHRLLRDGGLMVHGEDPQYDIMDPYDATLHDWGTRYNNEPYMSTMHELDLVQVAVDAGFERSKAFPQLAIGGDGAKGYRDQVYAGRFYFSGAVK